MSSNIAPAGALVFGFLRALLSRLSARGAAPESVAPAPPPPANPAPALPAVAKPTAAKPLAARIAAAQIPSSGIEDIIEPGRWMLLATEAGAESWIDFQTGGIATRRVMPPKKPARTPVLQAIRRSLQKADFQYHELDAHLLGAGFRESNGRYHVLLSADESARRISVWTAYGAKAPAHRLGALEALLTRINERLTAGRFTLDPASGDICVRTQCLLGDQDLATATVPDMMRFVVETADRWQPAVMRVLFGGLSADQVLGEEGMW